MFNILFINDRVPATMLSVIVVLTIAVIVFIGNMALCVTKHIQCRRSKVPSFRDNLTSYVSVFVSTVGVLLVVMVLYTAYVENETATWLMFVLFLIFAIVTTFMSIGCNLFKIMFFENELHWRRYWGRLRKYNYKDITRCWLGTRRGYMFVIFEFNDKKKTKLLYSIRLEEALKERKIKIKE